MTRQVRKPRRARNRLLITSAAINSDATTPNPSHSVRYDELKGISAAVSPRCANGSRTAVRMCSVRKVTAVSDSERCRIWEAKRGHVGDVQRVLMRMPSTTTAVSSSSDTSPAARVTYHRMLGLDAIRDARSRAPGHHHRGELTLTAPAAGDGRLWRWLQAGL